MPNLISKEFALDWTTVDEGILVFDVPVMSLLGKDERPDFRMVADIGGEWFRKAMNTFRDLKAMGKLPRLLRRHNKPTLEADVIGRLLELRWEEPWLKADALVTDPEAIDQVKRGELPSLSAEFTPDRFYLWGLSLIGGEEGHFDRELPDLLLKDEEVNTKKLSTIPEQRCSLFAGNFKLQEKEMTKEEREALATRLKASTEKLAEEVESGDLTLESLAEAMQAFQADVMSRLDNLEADVETDTATDEPVEEAATEEEKEAAAKAASDPTKVALAAGAVDPALLARMDKLELDGDVSRKVLSLRGKGHPMTDAELTTSLSECTDAKLREERYARLAAQPSVPTDGAPGSERKTLVSGVVASDKPDEHALGKEYDARQKDASRQKLKCSRAEYINANK